MKTFKMKIRKNYVEGWENVSDKTLSLKSRVKNMQIMMTKLIYKHTGKA